MTLLATVFAVTIAAPSPRLDSVTTEARSEAQPRLSAQVRSVIEAAVASGNPQAAAAVVRFAKEADPASAAEIDSLLLGLAATVPVVQEQKSASQAPAEAKKPLDGKIELGASRSTGSTRNLGFYGAIEARWQGTRWTHAVNTRVEIQDTNGVRTTERLSASWQPRLSFGERHYFFGLAQFERDKFVGLNRRYSAGMGAGYTLLDRAAARLELEGGPTFRHASAREEIDSSALAARGSINFNWKINPKLEFKQNGSLFLEQANGSAHSSTALEAAVMGPLRVRLSYEMRHERDKARELSAFDTTSRATVVYRF